MAKKFGLGKGIEALMPEVGLNSDDVSEMSGFSTNHKNEFTNSDSQNAAQAVKKAVENGNVPNDVINGNRKLPEGLNVDENGQLWLDVNLLKPNPYQPRKEFEEAPLLELAESIKEHGILQSITIEAADEGYFYIIAGERRTRAAKLAGLTEVPVQLRKFNDQKKLEIALIENIQREDLNPIEEAEAYYRLMELSGLSQEQVAERVGKNRSTVANAIRLLRLPEDIRSALVQGKISSGHARALLSVKDNTDMRILYGKILGDNLNVRNAEDLAKNLNDGITPESKPKKTSQPEPLDPNLKDIEQQFIEKLGTKVVFKGSMEKGSLEISYFSKDDLSRIYYLICGDTTN